MDRVAVLVDAGYLFAQGSMLRFGEKLPRGEIDLNYTAVASALRTVAETVSGVGLLRIYWYDGTSTGPTPQHSSLAYLDSVKVRLGFVNSSGEQKGVDSLIVTDMIALARNRAVSDAVLLSGDEDLRVGVQQAQDFGVRVHLLGIKPSRGSQSVFLIQEADTTHEWEDADLAPFLSRRAPRPTPSATPAIESALAPTAQPVAQFRFEAVIREIAVAISLADLSALVDEIDSARTIPFDHDRALLARSRAVIGRDLDSSEKRQVRKRFTEICGERLATQK
jgi:uncharacterized LabA/DUF88 family protein